MLRMMGLLIPSGRVRSLCARVTTDDGTATTIKDTFYSLDND